MEVTLKAGVSRNYKFTNRKYSKMIYKNELKEITLKAEANYMVESLSSNMIKVNCIREKMESDDRLSILLGESNKIFEEMITPPESSYGKESYKGTILDITSIGKRNAAAKNPIGDENLTPDRLE